MVPTLNSFLAVILMVKVNSATRFDRSNPCQSFFLENGVQKHLSGLVDNGRGRSLCGDEVVLEMKSREQSACFRCGAKQKNTRICVENAARHMFSRVDVGQKYDKRCKNAAKEYYLGILRGQSQNNQ